jgi:predicted DNA-binding transcriptional regulator AlpA
MENNSKESKALMIDYDAKQLAKDTAVHLEPIIYEIVEAIEQKAKNKQAKAISLAEAADFLSISRASMSKLISQGEIHFTSMNPEKPKSKKMFDREDLIAWRNSKKTKTISEIRKAARDGRKE